MGVLSLSVVKYEERLLGPCSKAWLFDTTSFFHSVTVPGFLLISFFGNSSWELPKVLELEEEIEEA